MIKYKDFDRSLSEGHPCHIYSKGLNSRGIFYTLEDFVLFFTMFACFISQTDILCVGFCIMFNHYHCGLLSRQASTISSFIDKMESTFSREYNIEHNTKGPLFKKQFGRSIKYVGKKIKGMLIYIANNPVAGRLKESAGEYKWNLIAYKDNNHPFSEPLPTKRHMRKRVKEAIGLIDAVKESGGYLNYSLQRNLFKDLSAVEKNQLVDYIISTYNFMNYDYSERLFGNWQNFLIAADANAGGEDDIPEDWEDYSNYSKMIKACKKNGIDLRTINSGMTSDAQIELLSRILRLETGTPQKQIDKFLNRRKPQVVDS